MIATAPTRMLREHYALAVLILATAPRWIVGAISMSRGCSGGRGRRRSTWPTRWPTPPGRMLRSEHVEFDANHGRSNAADCS